jgi:hypothetical protein
MCITVYLSTYFTRLRVQCHNVTYCTYQHKVRRQMDLYSHQVTQQEVLDKTNRLLFDTKQTTLEMDASNNSSNFSFIFLAAERVY